MSGEQVLGRWLVGAEMVDVIDEAQGVEPVSHEIAA